MDNLHPTRILITSGATQEPIDEVRYLGNHSSGKLGTLLASTAATEGYDVTLLYGHQSITPTCHPRLSSIQFSSSRDLKAKLQEFWPSHDILIMAAAVSDFTPRGGQVQGKKCRGEETTIALSPTDDIVASLAKTSGNHQKIIAFALEETEHLEERAKAKLSRKQVDVIIANPLETMGSSSIEAIVFRKDGTTINPPQDCSKAKFAVWLVNNLDELISSTCTTQ
jgi:phosphopantothenoylcysteine decarboxylase/phosphopantothenate--cysteine ligase